MPKRDRRQGKPDTRPGDKKVERRRGDRRRDIRVPVSIWVEEIAGEEELYFQQAGNLSVGGIYFERTVPHPPGTKVMLKFDLPGGRGTIQAEGEVVNVPNDPDGLGAGVKFTKLDAMEERLIREFIQEQLAKQK